MDVAVELDPVAISDDESTGGFMTWLDESPAWNAELHRLLPFPFPIDLEQLSGEFTPIIQQQS